MKFYILEQDYKSILKKDNDEKEGLLKIHQGTSVVAYKKWFFNCLGRFGTITTVNDQMGKEGLISLLGKPNAIHVGVNLSLNNEIRSCVPHRFLRLSLGSLLLPQPLYGSKYLPSAHIELVSTPFQKECLKMCLGALAPEARVFTPRVDTNYYIMPDNRQRRLAREKQGIAKNQFHIVYAGRWVVTKGICQLIRALDIWPQRNIVVTLAGNIEEENRLAFSFARHKTFARFIKEEALRDAKRVWLRFQEAKDRKHLRELFWSADLFVNLSTQPDENFGITPREAMSCGVPILTTNFCGLRPLAESMPWKGVDTYPTLLGSRFSLRQLIMLMKKAVAKRNLVSAQYCRGVVLKECEPNLSKANLGEAIRYLGSRPPETLPGAKDAERKIKKQLLGFIDGRVLRYYIDAKRELPGGAYVYGDGPSHYAFPVAQSIYSAVKSPPRVEKDSRWLGFFRIALWDKERALVEFGFPGPRIRRYTESPWDYLVKCAHFLEADEFIFIPRHKEQISLIQELVDLGYLVADY